MPGKYDKLFATWSEKEKLNAKNEILAKFDKLYKDSLEDPITTDVTNYDAWERENVDPFETLLIGPFTAKEFLEKIGLDMKEDKKRFFYKSDEKILLETLYASGGTLQIGYQKVNGKGMAVPTKDVEQEIAKLKEKDGSLKLNRWDKFCGFFGIKTDHARSVEMNLAGLEAYREKQQALDAKIRMKEPREKFLARYPNTAKRNKDLVTAAKENAAGWRELFFGDESDSKKRVPDYVLDNGKKVSALSLCMASLQRFYNKDLSLTNAKDFAELMKKDETLKDRVKLIGEQIGRLARSSTAKNLKHLDSFLNEKNDLFKLDETIKGIVDPKKPSDKYNIAAANDYNFVSEEAQKEKFTEAAVMFQTKSDMQKVLGKDHQIYGAEASDMEKEAKLIIKADAIHDAIEREDYGKLLRVTGFGKNYNKLEAAFESAENTLKQLKMNEIDMEQNEADLDADDFEM